MYIYIYFIYLFIHLFIYLFKSHMCFVWHPQNILPNKSGHSKDMAPGFWAA